MIASGMICEVLIVSVLALTPQEKYAAARGLGNNNNADYWLFVLAIAALMILVGLLWHVSKKRKVPTRRLSRELFAENALRRGLSPRERQILLAIAVRSGSTRSQDIFTAVEAFDRGAAKLLAECQQTRTVDENERLKTEVAFLREKLGFQVVQNGVGPAHSKRTSSRDIPNNSMLELTRQDNHAGVTIQAQVVRNDDIELAVDLESPVETQSSDAWRVRYSFGLAVWEFDTTAVGCDGKRLVLNHTDCVRFVNRRRFPRVGVTLPARVAHFPLIQHSTSESRRSQVGADRAAEHDEMVFNTPVFVSGVVTELAGPGLRIEASLEIRAGDRVIVAFQLAQVRRDENRATGWGEDECIVESVGQVRHWRSTGDGVSIAVELLGLSDVEIDTLVRITNQAAAQVTADNDTPQPVAQENAEAEVKGPVIGQEV